jgi:putative transposase
MYMPEELLFTERELKIARVLRPVASAPLSREQAMLAAQLLGIHWGSVYRLRKQFLPIRW